MSRRWLPTNAAAPVIGVQCPLNLGPDALLGPATTGPRYRRLGGAGEVEEVGAFGIVELERPRQCLQHALRDPAHVSTLQAGVVRNAHPGQDGDFLAAEPGHPATAEGAQPRLLGRDPGTARGKELADLLLRVHEMQRKPDCLPLGDPASSPINRDSHVPRSRAFLDEARGRDHTASPIRKEGCHEAHFARRT